MSIFSSRDTKFWYSLKQVNTCIATWIFYKLKLFRKSLFFILNFQNYRFASQKCFSVREGGNKETSLTQAAMTGRKKWEDMASVYLPRISRSVFLTTRETLRFPVGSDTGSGLAAVCSLLREQGFPNGCTSATHCLCCGATSLTDHIHMSHWQSKLRSSLCPCLCWFCRGTRGKGEGETTS